jgi:hypothetical protein
MDEGEGVVRLTIREKEEGRGSEKANKESPSVQQAAGGFGGLWVRLGIFVLSNLPQLTGF